MSAVREFTIDRCVLVHCNSAGEDAACFHTNSLGFARYFFATPDCVMCRNGGISKEFAGLCGFAATWYAGIVGQMRYRDKPRMIKQPRRLDFVKKQNVPLHGADFDYVDAASQSSTRIWLSNEATWQNPTYRTRIHQKFGVQIQTVNEYVPTLTTRNNGKEQPCQATS